MFGGNTSRARRAFRTGRHGGWGEAAARTVSIVTSGVGSGAWTGVGVGVGRLPCVLLPSAAGLRLAGDHRSAVSSAAAAIAAITGIGHLAATATAVTAKPIARRAAGIAHHRRARARAGAAWHALWRDHLHLRLHHLRLHYLWLNDLLRLHVLRLNALLLGNNLRRRHDGRRHDGGHHWGCGRGTRAAPSTGANRAANASAATGTTAEAGDQQTSGQKHEGAFHGSGFSLPAGGTPWVIQGDAGGRLAVGGRWVFALRRTIGGGTLERGGHCGGWALLRGATSGLMWRQGNVPHAARGANATGDFFQHLADRLPAPSANLPQSLQFWQSLGSARR